MWSQQRTPRAAVGVSPSMQPPDSPVVAAWRRELRIGQCVDAFDVDNNVWREAVVMALTDKHVRVHMRGWPTSWNKSYPLLSPRIAPAYARVEQWRSFKTGDHVQSATALRGQKDLVWSNASVDRVDKTTLSERKRVRVRLESDGKKRWMDAESEFLSMPETHETLKIRMPREDRGGDEELWIDRESLPLWLLTLRAGSEVEILDPDSQFWYEGRISGFRGNQVCVRYRGWPWRYDEWISIASELLAAPGSHLGNWRELELGQAVQLGFRASDHADSASHWVEGVVIRRSKSKTSQKLLRVEIQWNGVDGTRTSEWRDASDDFLAPPGVPTYPLPKKTKGSAALVPEPISNAFIPTAGGAQPEQHTAVDPAIAQPASRVVVSGDRDLLLEQLKRKISRLAEDLAEVQTLVEHIQSTSPTYQQDEPANKRARM